MISVIIPLYNKASQIVATLQSVLAQTFPHFEIVVVDDGSTDGSAERVEQIKDERIRIVRQRNAGVSAARNRGIEEARYGLIAFLDADDRWKPDFLQTQYGLSVKYPQCSVFAVNYEFIEPNGVCCCTTIRKLPFVGDDGVLDNYFEVAACSHPPICSSALMVRKEAMLSIGGFPLGIRLGEDLLTWARLACRYSIAYSRKAQAQYIRLTSASYAPPGDITRTNDDVAVNLLALFSGYKADARYGQMLRYLAFWYKMRSRINLTLGNRRAAICCAWESLKRCCSVKPVVFMFLAFLPHSLVKKIFLRYEK